MTKNEALEKIKELEDYIKDLNNMEVGYKNDELFLLSIDEYEKYKDVISNAGRWWLRSPGFDDKYAAAVGGLGWVNDFGGYVDSGSVGVRPAFIEKMSCDAVLGNRYFKYEFPFICIDEEKQLFIAEVPIAFNCFDDETNDYENSYVRRFLRDWANKR